MSEFKDLLENERRRHGMGGSFDDLRRRRDRKRRNRRIASGLVALLIAAVGVGGGLYAFRPTGGAKPAHSPTPTPSGTVSPPPVGALFAPPVSGAIEFVDAEHGWAVVNGGLVATSDGGASWQPVSTGSTTVDGVDFIDLQHGWVATGEGLRQTTDGGATWEIVDSREFISFLFVDGSRGWGIASGQFLTTEDGGGSWRDGGVPAESVCAAGGMVWASGPGTSGGTSFYRSTDLGATWTEFPMPLPSDWGAGSTVRCAPDGSEAFAVPIGGAAAGSVAYAGVQAVSNGPSVDQHVVLVSGLASGEFHPEGAYLDQDPYPGVFTVVGPGAADLVNWCPACENGAFFVSTHGEPAKVTDGDRTELPSTGPGPADPIGISFLDPNTGWLLLQRQDDQGLHPFVLTTTDGGATWTAPCDTTPSACFPVIPPKG